MRTKQPHPRQPPSQSKTAEEANLDSVDWHAGMALAVPSNFSTSRSAIGVSAVLERQASTSGAFRTDFHGVGISTLENLGANCELPLPHSAIHARQSNMRQAGLQQIRHSTKLCARTIPSG